MPEKNKFLQAALWYARNGWAVFPVTAGQKEPPLIKGWETKASTDEQQIRQWWKQWQEANVAVRTGDTFFAMDVDFRHGGLESIDALEHQHGKLRDTMRQVTGRQDGSYHLLYQKPPGEPVKNAQKACGWAGIDLRGHHGYILVHPSIHPDSGKEYFWDTAKKSIFEEPIAPADDWLLEAIRQFQNPNGAGTRKSYDIPPKFKKGEQHDKLTSYAGRLRYAGSDYEEILIALQTFNQTRCTEPGPREHIEQYARSMMNYAPGDRRALSKEDQEAKLPKTLPQPDSVDQILDAQIPMPETLIQDLLPRRGCVLVIGAQRSGKTIFAAQTAIALATNKPLFDNYTLNAHGPVIVFEKDDPGGLASFKDIYLRSKVPRGTPIDYYGKEKIPVPLGPAFLEWLELLIPKRGAVMVVLDSYTALRPDRKNGSDIVKLERGDIEPLDDLAKRLGCVILMIHHESITTRANGSLEWDARGAGTYGLTMASECQVGVARYRELAIDAPERMLRFRSRHLKEHQVTLSYNPRTGLFEHVIDGGAVPFYPVIHEIKRHIRQETFTPKDLEEPLGISRPTAFRYLAALVSAEAAWRLKGGTYRLAPDMERLGIRPVEEATE